MVTSRDHLHRLQGGRYSRRVELAACADDLAQRFGWQRSARWLGGSHEGTRSQVSAIANALCAVSEDDAASTDANIWAREDFADIDAADVRISAGKVSLRMRSSLCMLAARRSTFN